MIPTKSRDSAAPLMPADMWAAISHAICTRRSIRGYLDVPVDPSVILEILEVASHAPSGSNIQPWKVHVLTGTSLDDLGSQLANAFAQDEPERPEYNYYPSTWREPYLGRRRATGWGLYKLAGVKRGDRVGSTSQRAKNYRFFGAPVGMVFTIDNDLNQGSWVDYGMFLQSIMIAARGHGLDTCPQAAIANYPDILRQYLSISENETVVCGMALGFADAEEPTNHLITLRQPIKEFVIFHDGLKVDRDLNRQGI